jgi:hypothetical protein
VAVAQYETAGLDQVHRNAKTGGGAQQGSCVLGDIRLEQHQSHEKTFSTRAPGAQRRLQRNKKASKTLQLSGLCDNEFSSHMGNT